MSRSMKLRNYRSLLVMLILSLTSCSSPSSGCMASVHPSPGVKQWFKDQKPPRIVIEYLDKVGDEQKAIDESCSRFGLIV